MSAIKKQLERLAKRGRERLQTSWTTLEAALEENKRRSSENSYAAGPPPPEIVLQNLSAQSYSRVSILRHTWTILLLSIPLDLLLIRVLNEIAPLLRQVYQPGWIELSVCGALSIVGLFQERLELLARQLEKRLFALKKRTSRFSWIVVGLLVLLFLGDLMWRMGELGFWPIVIMSLFILVQAPQFMRQLHSQLYSEVSAATLFAAQRERVALRRFSFALISLIASRCLPLIAGWMLAVSSQLSVGSLAPVCFVVAILLLLQRPSADLFFEPCRSCGSQAPSPLGDRGLCYSCLRDRLLR
jgi:hypothetical protein